MQNFEIMALTDKQITALHKLPAADKLEIMHVCVGSLAVVGIEEYCYATGEKRRTVYQAAKDGKKMKFELSGHIFLAVNDK